MTDAFAGVIGHVRVLGLLEGEIAAPAHAYLFVGPVGVGKAAIARRFASAVLCGDGGHGPGSDCSVCRRVASGVHPDLLLVQAEGATSVGVDQARQTVAAANLTPVEGKRKIIVMEEAGMMTESAANALLKTLEEPSASTIFILVTESEDDLPPTVASRCRTVHFSRVPHAELSAALRPVAGDRAGEVATISGGRPGLALTLATEPAVADFRRRWLDVPHRVTPKPGEAFRLAEEMLASNEPLLAAIRQRQAAEAEASTLKAEELRREREIKRASTALLATGLEILASWYSDAAIAQFGGEVRNTDVPAADFVKLRPAGAVENAEKVLEAVVSLKANQRPTLVLTDLFAHLGASV